jgi:hypothetical protein
MFGTKLMKMLYLFLGKHFVTIQKEKDNVFWHLNIAPSHSPDEHEAQKVQTLLQTPIS